MNLRHPASIFKFLFLPQSEQPVDAGYFIHEEILNPLSCFNVGSITGCSFALQGRFKEQNVLNGINSHHSQVCKAGMLKWFRTEEEGERWSLVHTITR